MKLYSDSKAAIGIVHNPIQHNRMKHARNDRNFFKSEIDSGLISLYYIPTKLHEADVLIKALLRTILDSNKTRPGMIDTYSKLEGSIGKQEKYQFFSDSKFLIRDLLLKSLICIDLNS